MKQKLILIGILSFFLISCKSSKPHCDAYGDNKVSKFDDKDLCHYIDSKLSDQIH